MPMDAPGSVTFWIAQLKAGNQAAAQPLWENYFRQLVARTRRLLAGAPRRSADEEDVALSAFDSFCRAAAAGRFPRLNDRDDLWQLLVVLSDRKARNLMKYERRQRRGEGKVLDEAALAAGDSSTGDQALAHVLGQEPSPEFAAQVAEEYRRLLGLLGDDQLRRVAIRKMEGYSVEEIAAQEGRVPRTVKRWLRLIRQIWEREEFQP
jgi:DNA-directed RNA polymerase specialized sigma24 family protein